MEDREQEARLRRQPSAERWIARARMCAERCCCTHATKVITPITAATISTRPPVSQVCVCEYARVAEVATMSMCFNLCPASRRTNR